MKHANSILEYFEYFCQMSPKSIVTILSYSVSKLVRFFETQCIYGWHQPWCGVLPDLVFTARFRAMCAGVQSGRRQMCPKIKWWRAAMVRSILLLVYCIFSKLTIIQLKQPTDINLEVVSLTVGGWIRHKSCGHRLIFHRQVTELLLMTPDHHSCLILWCATTQIHYKQTIST